MDDVGIRTHTLPSPDYSNCIVWYQCVKLAIASTTLARSMATTGAALFLGDMTSFIEKRRVFLCIWLYTQIVLVLHIPFSPLLSCGYLLGMPYNDFHGYYGTARSPLPSALTTYILPP
jgi:hypothetical protein